MRTPDDGCLWPHHVDSPIRVYDRGSFEKYSAGEYKPPRRCICGAEITYTEPICICLCEHGRMTGDMLLEVKIPLTLTTIDLGVPRGD